MIRKAKEKPIIKPFEKIIVPDAAKQKYVKPEIKTKNIWQRSDSESLSASIKQEEAEIYEEHSESKWLLKCCIDEDILSDGTINMAAIPKNIPVKNIK